MAEKFDPEAVLRQERELEASLEEYKEEIERAKQELGEGDYAKLFAILLKDPGFAKKILKKF